MRIVVLRPWSLWGAVLLCGVLTEPGAACAQVHSRDALYPGGGEFSASFATGFPFVAMTEVAVGVTDRAAVGLLAGVTPRVWGIGVRPRVALWRGQSQRVTLIAPTLYYPHNSGRFAQPWGLTRPTLLLEQRTDDRMMLHLGVGLMLASALATPTADSEDQQVTASGFTRGVWLSTQVGGSLKLSSAWSAFVDIDLVYDVDGPSWSKVAAIPAVLSLGLAWLI